VEVEHTVSTTNAYNVLKIAHFAIDTPESAPSVIGGKISQ
jgi:hypothetical protein